MYSLIITHALILNKSMSYNQGIHAITRLHFMTLHIDTMRSINFHEVFKEIDILVV